MQQHDGRLGEVKAADSARGQVGDVVSIREGHVRQCFGLRLLGLA